MLSRDFHSALAALRQFGDAGTIRSLRSMAEEWLEAVEAATPFEEVGLPAARFNEYLILEWINDAAAQVFQRPPCELVGSTLAHLARACNLPTYAWCIRRALETRRVIYAYIRGSGSSRCLCEYRAIPGTCSVEVQMHSLARPRSADFTLAFSHSMEIVRVIE